MSFFRELTRDEFINHQLAQEVKDLKIKNKKLKRINHDLTRLMAEERKFIFEQYVDMEVYADSFSFNTETYPISPWTYQVEIKVDHFNINERFELNKFLRRYIRTKILPTIEKHLIKAFGIEDKDVHN